MKLELSPRLGLVTLLAWALGAASLQAQQSGNRSRSTSRSGSSAYPSSTEVGEAMISSDPETRKLIVVTDDETARQIGEVVKNLDRPAPQVLIKVVFLEVTYRKGSDIGVSGSGPTRSYSSGTNTLSYNPILQQFNGVSGISSGQGVFQYMTGDYQVMLRAIAESGKLEVLSRPTVLARNNQQATITVGQQVPLITNVRYDNFGNQINSISYQDVGIILRVTPFITSDDLVEMIVAPEISNLSDQTVSVATGTNSVGAPVINRRSADTVVVTPNDQTVVIGGLMQDNKTESVSKIPVLGDIPGLGALFRRKVKSSQKTELLIFLTPHIVKRPTDLIAMTADERTKTHNVQKAFTEAELNEFLDAHGTNAPAPATPTPAPKR